MIQPFDPLKVARAPKLREAAYAAIKEAIFDARLSAGEPLFEEHIAAALGISRTPVREALAILEHEGLIAPRQGKRLFIRDLTREEFLDMFSANEVIEPYLARRAALRANPGQIVEIQAAIDRGRQAAADLDLYASLRSGRDFHHWVGTAAANESLRTFVVRNEEKADLYLLSLGRRELISAENMTSSNQEHQQILDAIRSRDPEAAARCVIFHAQSLRARWAALFRSEQPLAPVQTPNAPVESRLETMTAS